MIKIQIAHNNSKSRLQQSKKLLIKKKLLEKNRIKFLLIILKQNQKPTEKNN